MGSDGTLWVGTGEANPSGGGLTFFGNGVYRSTDGGATWTKSGLPDSGAVGNIVVDPTDPGGSSSRPPATCPARRLSAASTGSTARRWQHVLATPNNTTGARRSGDRPANPDRVYATLWDHHRNNGARVYGGVGSGPVPLRRRRDVLAPAAERDRHARARTRAAPACTASRTLGRIGVAVAPSNPDRVYVISGTQYGLDKGFYVSDDGGDTFRPGGHAGGEQRLPVVVRPDVGGPARSRSPVRGGRQPA